MKRTLAVLLATLMLLMTAVPVFAAEGVVIAINDPIYNEDGTVTVTLDLKSNPGFYYLGLTLDVDTAVFESIKVENNLEGLEFLQGKQLIWYAKAANDNFGETGTLATITLTPIEKVPHTDFDLGIVAEWIECYDLDEADVACEIENSVVITFEHTVVHMEAVAPGCHYEGNTEYWVCYGCETVWADEALTQITNIKNVILPELGGEVIHVEAAEPVCGGVGNIEYWYCEECEQVWADEALTQLTNIKNVTVPALEHDLVHVEAVAPGCHNEGNIEHWYCTVCDTVWSDAELTQITNHKSVILPATGESTAIHMEAVAPGCHYEGNIEYWICYECEKVWADEALTQLTNIKNVILPELGGDVIHVDAKDATCSEEGNIEYWYCEECEQVWQDEALTQLTNFKNVLIGTLDHNLVHVEAVAPGCHYDGNIEHWYCTVCETVWSDAELTQITNHKSVILPATGEGNVVHMEAVEPGCHYTGNIEYWICYECEQVWQDEALTQLTNIKNVILPELGGEVIHVEAVAPGCEHEGNIEYWYCEECEQVWQDEARTQLTNFKNVILPANAHNIVHVEAVAPGCHYLGNVEHWYCTNCETVWTDEALTQISNHMSVILPELGGEVIHVEAVAPVCGGEGNIEYWYCEECEQVWQDEARTQLTNFKNVILPALEHNVIYVEAVAPGCHYEGNTEYWYCTYCDTVWADEALTQITNRKNVIIPATGEGNVVHFDAVEPGCHYTGNIEYWVCYDCEKVWQDEALTQLTNIKNVVLPELGGEVIHVEAVAPVCGGEGNIEYWYCEECEQVWQDEARTQLTNFKNVILPALEHNVVYMEAVEPGCHYTGNTEYWFCTYCETVWADEALTQITNRKNVIIPELGGEVIHVEAKDPTCSELGNIEYWYCEECMQVWQDEARTQLTNMKNVLIATLDHNIVHVDAVAPGCHYTGNVEHWYCTVCETVWTDAELTQISNHKSVILPELGGEVIHVAAKAPSCMELGNIEFWYCEECEQVWQDEARTQLTNFKNVILGITDHNIVHIDAVAPGCHYTGNVEHWYCTVCDTVWTDEALTVISNHKSVILPELGGEVVHVDAKAPSCMEEGNIEYWYCEECEQVWQDEARTQLTNFKNVILGVLDHTIVHVEAVAPGCHYEGNSEYWYCSVCNTVWADEALTQITNFKNVIIPATGEGNLVHMDAVAPGCHDNGNIEYWICYECEQVWQDEALTQLTNIKNVVIPATGEGEVLHFDAVAPGCHYEGNVEYWFCKDCEKVWTDADLTKLSNLKNVVLPELGGDVIHVAAKAPTATEDGNVEYWYCEKCEQVWIDEALTQISNIKSVVIPATGMVFGDINGDGKCDGKDYMMLKRHILGTLDYDKVGISEEDIIARGDINGDGKTEAKDFMMLKRYVLGTWTPSEK